MTQPFEADDLIRRGLLSSIIGFKKKTASRCSVNESTSRRGSVCGTSSHIPIVEPEAVRIAEQLQAEVPDSERTPFDIYREIVSDAEFFERSATTTPMSDLTCSTPTSPYPTVLSPQQMMPPEMARCPMMSHFLNPPPTMDHHSFMPPMFEAPPAYNMYGHANMQYPSTFSELPPQEHFHVGPIEVKKETIESTLLNNMNTQVTLEQFVKLVVTAVKESEENKEEENPEVILRRKRQQNNEAAARYRKRQREAREIAEGELSELMDRNNSLKATVDSMQREIEMLKQAVLEHGRT